MGNGPSTTRSQVTISKYEISPGIQHIAAVGNGTVSRRRAVAALEQGLHFGPNIKTGDEKLYLRAFGACDCHDAQCYTAHKNLLTSNSNLFKKHVNDLSQIKELYTEWRPLWLYIQWLYYRLIFSQCEERDHKTENEFTTLMQAYVLGGRLEDLDFKDAIIDVFVETMDKVDYTPIYLIRQIYEKTEKDSPFRRLIVDTYVTKCNSLWLHDLDRSMVTEDFLWDLARKLAECRVCMIPNDPYQNTCDYHEHKEGVCYKKKEVHKPAPEV